MALVHQRIREVIEQVVGEMGYDAVDVEAAAGGLLRVYIDTLDGARLVTIEDCERVTHQLAPQLAVEGIDYERLEVSSPGVDRPLRTEAHYRRFAGAEVTVRLREPFQGRRLFQGILTLEATADDAPSSGDPTRFGLELTEPEAQPKPVPGRRPARGPKRPSGPEDRLTGQKMVFSLDEVERTRLVPVIEFRRH